jgi:signal transduction histidine kinase
LIGLRRALWVIGLAGLAIGVLALLLIAGSDHAENKALTSVLGTVIGLSFIGTGLFAWWRRPENRFGALMVAVGFAFYVGAMVMANNPWIFTIGIVFNALYIAVIVHMLLAFPTGRVDPGWSTRLVVASYALCLALPLALALFREECTECFDGPSPDNKVLISEQPGLANAIDAAGSVIAALLLVGLGVLLVRRWRAWSPVQRRSAAPVAWTGLIFAAGLGVGVVVDALGAPSDLVSVVLLASIMALPYAFLAGLLRSRYSRAGAVAALATHLQGTQSPRDALAEALGDPSLRLLYRRADRDAWVSPDGTPSELPSGPGLTLLERDGEAIGALIHDPALDEEGGQLLRSAAGAAALAIDNERLAAELRARVAELQDSRSRLISAGLSERRRLERDLHDGAQQRLVALALQLGLARNELARDPESAANLLDGARTELGQALEELRELARGIHPAVLTERGLDAALEALAHRAPLPVDVDEVPDGRLPSTVEAAAYFVVAESLTNVAKYAQANHAHVRVERRNGAAIVEVSDDGVGGAAPGAGSGLTGLADRLAALDGRLEIQSPPGAGTTIRATIPCGS